MANIKFEQINNGTENTNYSNNIGFFSLKDDGDEAVVRFMHDSTDSFDLLTVHPIKINGKYRSVNCLRDPRDPMEKCPLCANGTKIQQKFYIHLIQYVKDENGIIVPQAKIWERPASYAITLKNLIDEYGALSNSVFKVRRNGKAGDLKTTYAILYGNPNLYNEDVYTKVDNCFDNYNPLGFNVLDKKYDELTNFIATGHFDSQAQSINVNTNTNSDMNPWNVEINTNGVYVPSNPSSYSPHPFDKPVRYY